MKTIAKRAKRGEGGFTLLEVLVSLFVLVFGLAALVGMALSGSRATGFARHASEAQVVGEDKMESLRVMSPALLDAHAFLAPAGMYTRTWTVTWNGNLANLVVAVSWVDDGQPHAITYRTMRSK
jgi:Tfp pilus assembly protein PilV